MRVHLQDHSGHVFAIQLARELAARGHEVDYAYSAQFETPHGRLDADPETAGRLRIEALSAARPFSKYSPVVRTRYELSYARVWRRRLEEQRPDVVVACNVPLFTLARMQRFFARTGQPWVLWHQDIYSRAISEEAQRVLPSFVGGLASRTIGNIEHRQVERAGGVVAISEAFVDEYRRWGLAVAHVRVLPNWTPLEDVVPAPRQNPWAERHRLPQDALRLLYAGTLGRKHNPQLLLAMLDEVQRQGVRATLTVVSEGAAADDLAAAANGRADVQFLPFQPAAELSDMVGSADVCVALLEESAAQFSVPSKVLTYACAGRPTIALVPGGNLAAHIVTEIGGCVAPPTSAGAAEAAEWLVHARREDALPAIGARAREYAERNFDIARIGTEFEKFLRDVLARDTRVRESSLGDIRL